MKINQALTRGSQSYASTSVLLCQSFPLVVKAVLDIAGRCRAAAAILVAPPAALPRWSRGRHHKPTRGNVGRCS